METQKINELHQAALNYARMGLPIFPCRPKEKKPLTEHGFKDASTVPNQINLWWQRWPKANIAMATGASSGILVLDVDQRNGGEYSFEHLVSQYGELPHTVVCFTGGGGRHYYFKHPGNVKCSDGMIASGIDIKADGGYVMMPPSIHESGKTYGYELSSDIAEVPIADCPQWLVELARDCNVPKRTEEAACTQDSNTIREGKRDKTLASLAGHLRSVGLEESAIYAAITDINNHRCIPPLEERQVRKIAHSIARYEPNEAKQAAIENGSTIDLAEAGQPDMCALSTIESKPIEWLWPSRIPIGKLSVLAGDPGLGKSFVSLDMAARVSTGAPWPDQPLLPQQAGSAILLSAEDDPADTIKPRLEQMDADCSHIHIIRAVKLGDGKQKYFDLSTDLEVLKQAIVSVSDCRLVVIDPISAYLGKLDGHSNTEIRGLLAPLADIAAAYGVAVLVVTHLNKGGGANPLYRAMGSLAFVAAARTVWMVTCDKDEDDKESPRRLMLPAKNNIAEDNNGLAYMIVNNGVLWEDSTVEMTAGKFFKEQFQSENSGGSSKPARGEAIQFLKEILKDGPMPSKEIDEAAKAACINHNTLRSAKIDLGITASKIGLGKDSKWYWLLPNQTKEMVSDESKKPAQ